MPRICYKEHRFSAETWAVVEQANDIVEEYAEDGFDLTLRQLFYQFVSRDLIPNTQKSYNRLGTIINDARLAGHLDWESIVDRTRHLRENPHWDSIGDIIEMCSTQFQYDKWDDQRIRIEVWIEKDALVGVLESLCEEEDVPLFSCRGYTSQSSQWRAGRRMRGRLVQGKPQATLVLHLGDHDPSGLDMTRDISERLKLFTGENHDCVRVIRIALNYDQIEKYQPPPNPTKLSDTRARSYIEKYGGSSWELDALEPNVLNKLVRDHIYQVRNDDLWEAQLDREKEARDELIELAATMEIE